MSGNIRCFCYLGLIWDMFGRWSVQERTVSNVLHMSKLETGLLWEIIGELVEFLG